MLKIEINSKEVFINDLELSVEIVNNAFEFDEVKSSIIFPVSVPLQNNAHVIKHLNRINTRNEINFVCEIMHSGLNFFAGEVNAITTAETIDFDFVTNEAYLFNKLAEKKIRDVAIFNIDTLMNWKDFYSPETDFFAMFPVKCENYFEGTTWANYTNVTVNEIDYTKGGFKFNTFPFIAPNPWTMSIFPALWYVIEQTLIDCGFTVNYNMFKEDNDLKNIVIFSNFNAIQLYKSDPLSPNLWMAFFSYKFANHLPDISAGEFLLSLKKAFNFRIDVYDNSISLISNENTFTNRAVDISSKIINSQSINHFNQYDNIEVGLSQFSDDAFSNNTQLTSFKWPVYETQGMFLKFLNYNNFAKYFFQYIENFDGINLTVVEKLHSLLIYQNYNSKVQDYYANQIYQLLAGEFSTTNNFPIISEIGTMQQLQNPSEFMPLCSIKGEHNYSFGENRLTQIILLQQLGTKTYIDQLGVTRYAPYGSHDCYDAGGAVVSNLRLKMIGDITDVGNELPAEESYTLRNLFWNKTINLLLQKSKEITFQLNLKAHEIKHFDFASPYKIENNLYICLRLRYVMKRNTIDNIEGDFMLL